MIFKYTTVDGHTENDEASEIIFYCLWEEWD